MVAWQTDDVLLLHYDRLSASNYTRPYIGVYTPDGTVRGYIDPINPPPTVFLGNAAFQYQMKFIDDHIFVTYSGSTVNLWHILKIDQDGNVEIFANITNNVGFTLHIGVARDQSSNIYHLDGPSFNFFDIVKRDSASMQLERYVYERQSADNPNLFSNSASFNQAATLEFYDNVLYFNGTLNSLGAFVNNSPYGINRIDTSIQGIIPYVNLNDALIMVGWLPGTQSISMMQFVIDRNGYIYGAWENETLNQFIILTVDNLGNYIRHFQVFPQDPNDVGNSPEIDFVALSNDQSYIWVCEHAGPNVAYNLTTGAELYRWHFQINIDTRLDFAMTVVTSDSGSAVYQGLERINPGADLQWGKYSGF